MANLNNFTLIIKNAKIVLENGILSDGVIYK